MERGFELEDLVQYTFDFFEHLHHRRGASCSHAVCARFVAKESVFAQVRSILGRRKHSARGEQCLWKTIVVLGGGILYLVL